MFIINFIFFVGQGFEYQVEYKEKRGKWLLKSCLKLTDTCKTAKGKDTKFLGTIGIKNFTAIVFFVLQIFSQMLQKLLNIAYTSTSIKK